MELLKENERSANKAAAKVMRITIIVFAVVLLLDILGIFVVDLSVMITAFIIGTILLLVPSLLVNVGKNGGGWVKYAIVLCTVLFTMIINLLVDISYKWIDPRVSLDQEGQ